MQLSVCLAVCLSVRLSVCLSIDCIAVHIYLCDDAPKDHKEDFKGESFLAVTLRQQLTEQLYKIHGIPVIRVDRDKGKNESNPKSANLNSCLKKIYGENATPPAMEVVAVFDADQAAHSHFFTSTLPWMDAGDDVAVVQSPQVGFCICLVPPSRPFFFRCKFLLHLGLYTYIMHTLCIHRAYIMHTSLVTGVSASATA